ncbi:MAG: OmpA family protein [Hormoscilla sp.]
MATSKQNQASKSKQDGLLSDGKTAAQLEGLVSLLLGLEFTNQQSAPAKESSDQYSSSSQAGSAPDDGMLKSVGNRPGSTGGVGTGVPGEPYSHSPGKTGGSYVRGRSEKLWQLGTEERAGGDRSYVGFETESLRRGENRATGRYGTPDNLGNYQQAGDNEAVKALEALSSLLLGTSPGKTPSPQQKEKRGSQSTDTVSTDGLLVMHAELESASVPQRPKSWSSSKVASEILVTEEQLVRPYSQTTPMRESSEGSEERSTGQVSSEYDVEDLAASLEALGNLLTGRPKQEKEPSQQSSAQRKGEKTKRSALRELSSVPINQQAALGELSSVPINQQAALGELSSAQISQQAPPAAEKAAEISVVRENEDRSTELASETESQLAEPEVESLVKTAASSLEKIGNLAGLEADDLRIVIAKIEQKLADIERQTGVINPLMPLLSEMVGLDLTISQEESIRVIVPIIDKVIQLRSKEDREGMSAALADLLPGAISKQIQNSPEEIARAIGPEMSAALKEQMRIERDSISEAIAPEMGKAIKAQIELERDSMVDALYPVIGSTISKYMADVIRSINEKVENALSPEGIRRKIRAKMQGVSEGELILQESKAFATQAVFLIHKESGLVIAEAQPESEERLESEMVAGMLTAIRSFVNDCIVQSGEMSELDAIDYGEAKIILEVAGYSYLAVVVKGEPPKQFIAQVRQTLSTIVRRYGKQVEEFDGDPATVPEAVTQLIEKLLQTSSKDKASKAPPTLVMVGLALLLAVLIPWGIHQHRSRTDRLIEEQTTAALASAPELSVYNIAASASQGTVILKGRVPNDYLRSKAEAIAKAQMPEMEVDNQIIAVNVPPDPVLAAKEVERVTKMLNQREGISISTLYEAGNVTVQGTVFEAEDAQQIPQALEEIPGVSSVFSTLKLKVNPLDGRIYFDLGSAELHPGARSSKLVKIKEFLHEYPEINLMVIGHSDKIGSRAKNQHLSLQRAIAVKRALESMGVAPGRLQVFGTVKSPPDVKASSPPELSRCVRFELFRPVGKGE